MISFLDKLNLRPNEKRLVVGVVVVFFVVLNIWFVWPHFKDRARIKDDLENQKKNAITFQQEIAKIPEYEARKRQLEGEGSAVPPEEQPLQAQLTVSTISSQNGFSPNTISSQLQIRTNAFFQEQTVNMTADVGEKELVNFLYTLGAGSSMIRVYSATLRPNQYRLSATMTLVASYQRNPKTAPATPKPQPALNRPSPAPAGNRSAAPPSKKT